MKYRRALLLLERPHADARAALATLAKVAPSLERLVVLVRVAPPMLGWLAGETAADAELPAALEALHAQAALAAPSVELHAVPELAARALTELAATEAFELLVVAARTRRTLAAVSELRRSAALTVLFAGERDRGGAIRQVSCFAESHRARAMFRAFLRDQVDDSLQVTLFVPPSMSGSALALTLEVAGIHASVDDRSTGDASLGEVLERGGAGPAADLLVVARLPLTAALGAAWPSPVLLLPPATEGRPVAQRALDVADLFDDGGPLRVRLDQLATIGDLTPIPDQHVTFVAGGQRVATAAVRDGEAEFSVGPGTHAWGVFRGGGAQATR